MFRMGLNVGSRLHDYCNISFFLSDRNHVCIRGFANALVITTDCVTYNETCTGTRH